MKKQNNIDEIFKEAFDQFEVDPGADVWTKVQSGINSSAAASSSAAAGSAASSWVATAVVGLAISAAAVGGYYFFNQQGEAKVEAAIEANKSSTKENQPINTKSTLQAVEEEEDTSLDVAEKNAASGQKAASIQQPSSQQNTEKSFQKDQADPVRQLSNSLKSKTKTNNVDDQEIIESKDSENLTASSATKGTDPVEKNASSTDKSNEPVQSTNQSVESNATSKTNDDNSAINSEPVSINDEEKVAIHIDFPNIITPNQDGTNDKFAIRQEFSKGLDQVEEGSMQIRNTTNKIVAVWKGVNGSWDGSLPNGSNAPSGSYIYQFVYTVNGEPQAPLTGIITLKR